ncbi:MAG: PAS domain-containing protein [Alphaproteobacteria bacterium]
MIRIPSLPVRSSEPANARAHYLWTHALGAIAGLSAALAWALVGAPSGLLAWAALVWLASPLLLAALAYRPIELATLELFSTLNMILVLVALAAVSGGTASVFLAWLILVPAEAALTRRPRHLFIAILAGCLGIASLWVAARLHGLPPFALEGPLGASLRALVLGGALVYAGVLAAAVQRAGRAAARSIAEREASYRFLADNAVDPILRISASGTVLYASPASEELFGRPRARIERMPIADLVAEGERASLQHALVRATYFGEEGVAVCSLGDGRTIEVRCRSVLRAPTRHRRVAGCSGARRGAAARDHRDRSRHHRPPRARGEARALLAHGRSAEPRQEPGSSPI